tara:strand:- start:4089 stop:4721 length:633 start_codon:yes stop_codon:yes gene_type:complete
MLELKNITYQPQTGNKIILNDLNLKINENEVILICGKSGSGKTSLLEIISGLTDAQKGSIFWRNKSLTARQRRWLCGLVFQFPERYFIGNSIGNELKIGHQYIKDEIIRNVLEKVGLSKINLKMSPEKLSGGQQRRLAVAVQLLRDPKLILFDEPTAGLDWSIKNDVTNLIDELRVNNTILIVTHEPKLFKNLPTKIYTLNRGKLVSSQG